MQTDRPIPDLSPREQQLLKYAAEGFTDTAIAHKLGISEATVGTYWGRVRIKLGPYSRTELVAIMLRTESEAAIESLRRENNDLVLTLRSQGNSGSLIYYREMLENAPDAMLLVSEDGIIECANAAARELFGYEAEELLGSDLLALIPKRFREKHGEHRVDFLANPDRRKMGEHLDTPALNKSGEEFPIRAALSAIPIPSGTIVMCIIRPIEGSGD